MPSINKVITGVDIDILHCLCLLSNGNSACAGAEKPLASKFGVEDALTEVARFESYRFRRWTTWKLGNQLISWTTVQVL
jgi:hypothetical protein